MASRKQLPTMVYIPDEVLLNNIFVQLPAKMVAQMRCVSKPWNAFLSQPSFIKSHLDHSICNNDEVVIVFYSPFSLNFKPFTAHPCRFPCDEVTSSIKVPVNTRPKHAYCYVIGSVNGLICFVGVPQVVHIWNPTLSAMLSLPPSNSTWTVDCHNLFRFGFDPKTDDYKVVKITGRHGTQHILTSIDDIYEAKEWLQVEVFSMRKSCWKVITQKFPSQVKRIYYENEVSLDGRDGHLHWIGCLDESKPKTIVAFDLSVETFNEISLPDSIQGYNEMRSLVVGFRAGKLCAVSHLRYTTACDVWVMNEYGVAKSWVKHTLSLKCGFKSPIGFTLNNEFLFVASDESLALYDPSHPTNAKSFQVSPIVFKKTKIVQFVDSLVWVATW
ncbi:F-box domain-containing protein [Artemisia annua]|uniref:F-box domain-containing protein n=1 Tax=Artemisia annua TaxID=35608 RepID=A0A2U1LNG3_ARTAN|nr:F-box domain-containing protein [Artemisia annua]